MDVQLVAAYVDQLAGWGVGAHVARRGHCLIRCASCGKRDEQYHESQRNAEEPAGKAAFAAGCLLVVVEHGPTLYPSALTSKASGDVFLAVLETGHTQRDRRPQ
jgi:hypothetical protein